MFRGAYQKKLLTILYSGGSNPLEIWDIQVKNGWTRRVKDEDLACIVFEICGTNVATAYIVSPPDPRNVLGITLPFITMFIKNLKRYFTFEIQILDDKHMRRRFRFSNYQSSTKVRPFTCSVPLALKPGWNQMQLNLANFTTRAYGTNYMETQRVQIHANCRIRRVYFSDRLYAEEELPREYRIYLNVRQAPQEQKTEPSVQSQMSQPPSILKTGSKGSVQEQSSELVVAKHSMRSGSGSTLKGTRKDTKTDTRMDTRTDTRTDTKGSRGGTVLSTVEGEEGEEGRRGTVHGTRQSTGSRRSQRVSKLEGLSMGAIAEEGEEYGEEEGEEGEGEELEGLEPEAREHVEVEPDSDVPLESPDESPRMEEEGATTEGESPRTEVTESPRESEVPESEPPPESDAEAPEPKAEEETAEPPAEPAEVEEPPTE